MPARPRTPTSASASPAPSPDWTPPVSDETVTEKTGRSWEQWISALDADGCATMSHGAIVKVVADRFDIGPWWQQTVTVGYERARGLRQVNETAQGFGANASKTVNAGVDELWRAWDDTDIRQRWLPEVVSVRKASAPKSIRMTWSDGSDVQAWFTDKGPRKSSVAVDHRKLQQADVEPMKTFWKARLGALKQLVEDGRGTGGRGRG